MQLAPLRRLLRNRLPGNGYQPIPLPVQRLLSILIATLGGCDLFRMRPPGHWAGQHIDAAPAMQHAFDANHHRGGSLAVLVAFDFDLDSVRHYARHPVGYPRSSTRGGCAALEHICEHRGGHEWPMAFKMTEQGVCKSRGFSIRPPRLLHPWSAAEHKARCMD
jgi:hypothetical protein